MEIQKAAKWKCGVACDEKKLHLGEVVHDVRVGPVLRADELTAEGALAVDDVGFGNLDGAVEGVDALVGVADGDEVDVVFDEELVVDVGILVHADGDDFEVGHLLVESEQAGELFDAGRAPGGPEIEHDDVAAEFGEIDGVGAVGDGELGRGLVDVVGMGAAVAAGNKKHGQSKGRKDFRHWVHHF